MKWNSVGRFICWGIILIFLFAYFLEFSGYYEYNLYNKKNLTESQIEKFEEDVKSGKEIDLKSYLTEYTVDYSNSLTRTTSEVSLRLNEYLKRALAKGFGVVGKFIK